MRKLSAAALLLLAGLCLSSATLFAQQFSSQQRAQELAASFNKSKHRVKERRGVRVEKFKEVRNEPVVKADVREYAGTYVASVGMDYPLKVAVASDGHVEVTGSELSKDGILHFTLRDAKIDGGLLTGTKVYADGSTEKFEGVFINRTERDSPTAAGTTSFGLGVVYNPPRAESDFGFSLVHLFYQRQ
ncbi:MAG: hypothetical protein M3362_05310 [Acidobacteriota bacterium]|nr:hypothetical protein [Acidobacteriota bacterium]